MPASTEDNGHWRAMCGYMLAQTLIFTHRWGRMSPGGGVAGLLDAGGPSAPTGGSPHASKSTWSCSSSTATFALGVPSLLGDHAGEWVNAHPFNQARHGLPTVMGTYVLSDPGTRPSRSPDDGRHLPHRHPHGCRRRGWPPKYLAKLPLTRVGFVATVVSRGCAMEAAGRFAPRYRVGEAK